jgi:hypothetical protein
MKFPFNLRVAALFTVCCALGVGQFAMGQLVANAAVSGKGAASGAASASGCLLGDQKFGFQSTDHGGWIKLNGRIKVGLTPTQQTQATALGFGANIPDFSDRSIVTSSGTKSLLSTGGAATTTLTQANLPAVSLVGGNHGHSVSDPGHNHSLPQANNGTFTSNGAAGSPFGGSSYGSGSSFTGIGIAASGNLSIPLGGSGTALATQSPYVAMNAYVCLGL